MSLIEKSYPQLNQTINESEKVDILRNRTIEDKTDLLNGASKEIDAPIVSEPRLVATVRTISEKYLNEGAPDFFTIIDLRGVPVVEGFKLFDGQKINPETQYIIIDPAQLNWEKGVGYKGIYFGDKIEIGRFDPAKELTPAEKMKRDRFPGLGPWTSRSHFSVACSKDGKLELSDLNSSNGTALAEGDSAIDFLLEGEHRKKIEEITKPVGETAVESQVRPEFITTESRAIMPIIDSEKLETVEAEITDSNNPEINRTLAKNFPELMPKFELDIRGDRYLFSSIIEMSSGRLHAVAFVEIDGKYLPRLFYKSKSEGGWRSCPGWEKSNRRYSKGPIEVDGGYVQVTKPVEELAKNLEDITLMPSSSVSITREKGMQLLEAFDLDSDEMHEVDSFDQELSIVRLDERSSFAVYDSLEPGIGFKQSTENARRNIENMVLPPGFEPDFNSKPIRQYNTTHTIGGLTKVSVYSAMYLNRPIEWHIAESESGNTWIDSIRFADAKITSYGTPSEVILAGALNCKPFDYAYEGQLEGMELGEDFDWINGEHSGTYVSMQKTLDRIPVIKRFKESLKNKKQ